MHVQVDQKELNLALNIVSKAVNNNNTLPILNNLLLKTENQSLVLSATNLEIAITLPIEAQIIQEGATTVPAKLLQSYISLLKPELLDLRLEENNQLTVQSSKSETQINTIDFNDYPSLPQIEQSKPLIIDSKELVKALNYTSFACSLNTTQPVLSGVYLNYQNKKLTFAATDSYRLSEYKIHVDTDLENEITAIVPQKAMQELSRIIQAVDPNEIKIYLSKDQISFEVENVQILSRLIDGKYPEYQKILPKELKSQTRVLKSELNLALKRVNLFAKESNNSIHIDIDSEKHIMVVKSDQTKVGQELSEISVSIEGPTSSISINSVYLSELLNVLQSDELNLLINEKTTPIQVTEPENPNFLYIIMPLRV